jgi:hypothetical protein
MVKVELCDVQIIDHINYARQKWLKWATSNATQDVYFTVLLQAGKKFYDLPAGILDVIAYDDEPIQSGGINTLFTIDNMMFSSGFYGNMFWGGYDLVSYHLVQDFMKTMRKYRATPYNWRYHKSTNQLEINPTPGTSNGLLDVQWTNPSTGIVDTVAVDSPGWIMLRCFTASGATLPNYSPAWSDVLKEKKVIVESITVSAQDVVNKYVTLKHTPAPCPSDTTDYNIIEDTSVSVGGLTRTKTIEWDFYTKNLRVITWDGFTLDGEISAGDIINVKYPVIFQSQLYQDEDWTSVSETCVETEHYQLYPNDIVAKEITLQRTVWEDNIRVSVGKVDHVYSVDYIVNPYDKKTISWADLGLENIVVEGDIIEITYVHATGTVITDPSYTGGQSMIKQYVTKIENLTVSAQNVIDGYLTVLDDTVAVGDGVKLSIGGMSKVYNKDYTIVNDEINNKFTVRWVGYAMAPLVAENDSIIMTYTSSVPIMSELDESLYDEDWIFDYVTAMSKISLGLIRRKFSNFSSLGNQGITMDGDSLVSEGNTEKEYLEQTLRDEEPFEGYGIELA